MIGVSMRSTWFELVQSLALFDTPILLSTKLGCILQKRMRQKSVEF